jgi:transposase
VKTSSERFSGLSLSDADKIKLGALKAGGNKMTARRWRRVRILELLDQGLSARAAAQAAGCYPREVTRVGKRYVARGLEAALTDETRPKPPKKFDSVQVAAIVAMVCGPVPKGCARWSTALIAKEAVRRGIVKSIGRETVRTMLADHGLKPWREKNVVRPGDQRRVRRPDGRCPRSLRAAA